MSLYDYETGERVVCRYGDDEFYGLIQACMRLADTDNLAKLKAAFPDTWQDLQDRYNAPGGHKYLHDQKYQHLREVKYDNTIRSRKLEPGCPGRRLARTAALV